MTQKHVYRFGRKNSQIFIIVCTFEQYINNAVVDSLGRLKIKNRLSVWDPYIEFYFTCVESFMCYFWLQNLVVDVETFNFHSKHAQIY